MRFKNFPIGKSKDRPEDDSSDDDENLVTQIEQVNDKTRELEAAERQIKSLSEKISLLQDSDDDPPRPHGPLGELTVGLDGDDSETESLFDESEEEAPVTEVIKLESAAEAGPEEAPEEVAEAASTETPAPEPEHTADDSLANLFRDEEDEENPLASLINFLPEVSSQELLDDINELKEIIRERHEH